MHRYIRNPSFDAHACTHVRRSYTCRNESCLHVPELVSRIVSTDRPDRSLRLERILGRRRRRLFLSATNSMSMLFFLLYVYRLCTISVQPTNASSSNFSTINRSSAEKLAEKNLSQRFTIGIRRRRRRRFLAFQVSAESWILFNVINVSNRTRDATLKNRSIGRNEKNISRSRFSRFFIYIHIHIHVQRVRWEKPLDKCVEFLPGYAYDDFSFIEYHLFIVSDANERTANRVSTGRALKERRYCSSGKTTTRTSDFRESSRKKRIRLDLEVLVPG